MSGSKNQFPCRNQCLGPGTSVWTQQPVSGPRNQCLDPGTCIWAQKPVSGSMNRCLGPGTNVWAQQPVSGPSNRCLSPRIISVWTLEPVSGVTGFLYPCRNQCRIKDLTWLRLRSARKQNPACRAAAATSKSNSKPTTTTAGMTSCNDEAITLHNTGVQGNDS